jgi:capsular exopolysaccharide synthesis family protein
MDNDTISVKHLIQLMLNKIWLIILLFVLGAGIAYSAARFLMPLEYQSYTSMYVKNSTASNSDDINLNDLNASKSLVTTYIAVLQDDAVMEAVGDALIEEYGEERISEVFTVSSGHISPSALRGCLTMASVDSTEVMKITAVTTDPEISAAICNTVAEVAPDFLVRVVGAGSVEAIGKATIHNTPVSPNIPKYTAMGAIVGAVLAVAIIFLLDFFDNTVKEAEELSKKYGKAIIGEIQDISSMKNKKKKDEDVHWTLMKENIPFYITESYKAIRTNIAFALAASDKKIFVVSSANPAEGKSTTSANIALALAMAEHRVLLIDGDMRKPVQHQIFGLGNKKGFSSAIGRMHKTEECIHKNVAEHLDVMPSGPKPPNPSELLASERAAEILTELSEKYDYIIIDTPPVNVVSDAMGLSRQIAGMLLVLKYGFTTFEDIDNAMKKISLAEMNLLGFILNDITGKGSHGGYYNYKYQSRYGYSDYGSEKSGEADKSSKE